MEISAGRGASGTFVTNVHVQTFMCERSCEVSGGVEDEVGGAECVDADGAGGGEFGDGVVGSDGVAGGVVDGACRVSEFLAQVRV